MTPQIAAAGAYLIRLISTKLCICSACDERWVVAQMFNLLYRRLAVGRPPVSPRARELAVGCGLQIRDTAQRGGAATKGARVCDPQELCRPASVLTSPAHRSLSTCCGSQSRAPQSRRDLRRFGQILLECNSALRRCAKHVPGLIPVNHVSVGTLLLRDMTGFGLNRRPGGRLTVVGYPSGQRGQTVNLLAYAFAGSNPAPTTTQKPLVKRRL